MSKNLRYSLSIVIALCFYLTGFAQPANDECANAISVGTGTHDFTSVDATTGLPYHPTDCTGGTADSTYNDVWFLYTADFTGNAEFSTCGTADFDTNIAVYGPGAACPPAVEDLLGCSEDADGCSGFTSKVIFQVLSGESYLLRIGGWGNSSPGEEGTGTFSVGQLDPPANDECDGAIAVGSGNHDFISLEATTGEPYHPEDCEGGTADSTYNDVWFLYTADFTGPAEFSTCGTADFDTNIAAYASGASCPPNAADLLGCSEDGDGCPGFTSKVTFDVVEGESYLLRIGGWGNSSPGEEGSGSFYIGAPIPIGPPANDECTDATAVGTGSHNFSSVGATTGEPYHPEDCVGGAADSLYNDIWFTWTADFTGPAVMSTCGTANFDTNVAVYGPGAPCPPTVADLLSCSEDASGCNGFTSEAVFDAVNGETYLLRIGGWGSGSPGEEGSGSFFIGVYNPVAPPANDVCETATPANTGTNVFSNINATTGEPYHPEDCAGGTADSLYNDVWYLYTATFTGTAVFSTCGSATFDTNIAAYAAGAPCPPAASDLLACSEDGDGCVGFTSEVTFDVVNGEQYLLRIGGWGSSSPGEEGFGTFIIDELNPDEPGPPNDDCGDAIELDLGDDDFTEVEFSTIGANTSEPFYSETVSCFDVPNGEIAAFNDIWYTWTATFTGFLEWSNCGTSNFDSHIAVYGPDVDCQVPDSEDVVAACSDDGTDDAGNTCGSFTSRVIFPVEEGSTYLFRLGGWSENDAGTGTFIAQRVAPPTIPTNDDCVNADTAYIITVEEADNFDVIFPGFTNNASVEGPTPTCQTSGEFLDVWYKFNSENFTDIELRFNRVSSTHFYIDIFQDCINLPVDGPDICFDTDGQTEFFSLSLPGFPGQPTDYLMRVSTRVTSDPVGEFWFQLVEGMEVDLNEIGFNKFNFYPNPVFENAHVVFEIQESTSAQYQILNTLGQVLCC